MFCFGLNWFIVICSFVLRLRVLRFIVFMLRILVFIAGFGFWLLDLFCVIACFKVVLIMMLLFVVCFVIDLFWLYDVYVGGLGWFGLLCLLIWFWLIAWIRCGFACLRFVRLYLVMGWGFGFSACLICLVYICYMILCCFVWMMVTLLVWQFVNVCLSCLVFLLVCIHV